MRKSNLSLSSAIADYIANGGTIQRVPTGQRSLTPTELKTRLRGELPHVILADTAYGHLIPTDATRIAA